MILLYIISKSLCYVNAGLTLFDRVIIESSLGLKNDRISKSDQIQVEPNPAQPILCAPLFATHPSCSPKQKDCLLEAPDFIILHYLELYESILRIIMAHYQCIVLRFQMVSWDLLLL